MPKVRSYCQLSYHLGGGRELSGGHSPAHPRSTPWCQVKVALAKFGEAGVVELATIQGYYTYLAMVMNAARVGVPPNQKPTLERFPR